MRHHAPAVVESALRADEEVATLLGDGLVGVLDVVEGAVLHPLVLRKELEGAGVGVVVGAPVLVLAIPELCKLVGTHWVAVLLLVYKRLRGRNVPENE